MSISFILTALLSAYVLSLCTEAYNPKMGSGGFNSGRGHSIPKAIAPELLEIGKDIEVIPSKGTVKNIVMKFGGSSLATPERVMYVAKLVQKHVDMGYKPIVVCSAMGKTTNALLSAGEFALEGSVSVEALRTLHSNAITQLGAPLSTSEQIDQLLLEMEQLLSGIKYIGELSPRTLDTLVSFGERLSVRIMAATLNNLGVPALPFDSWTLGMTTSGEFMNAEVLDESYDKIKEQLKKFDGFTVPVVTGFIGKDKDGHITTLGRGGSDLTATVLGASSGVDEIQVWKDVDGILTADPRVVPQAIPVNEITYEEAAELAYFGAQVLHPIAMQPAIKTAIPVRVKNSYNPLAVGSIITNDRDKSETLVTAITSKSGIRLIDIVSTKMLGQYGFLAKVFQTFDHYGVSVDVVATSEVSVSLTLDRTTVSSRDIPAMIETLSEYCEVKQYDERAIISLICNVDRAASVMGTAFRVMEKMGKKVEMLSQGASKVNIGLVVKQRDKDEIIKAFHQAFFESHSPEDL